MIDDFCGYFNEEIKSQLLKSAIDLKSSFDQISEHLASFDEKVLML